jgi:hypothetical protein
MKKTQEKFVSKVQASNKRLKFLGSTLASLAGLLWKEVLMNLGQNTTLSDGNMSEKLVQFLVVSDGQLQVTRNDTGLLVVTGGVSSQFQDFSCEIFEDGGQVDWGASTDTLSVVSFPQQPVNTTDWESETSLGGSALGGLCATGRGLSTRFSTGCHCD